MKRFLGAAPQSSTRDNIGDNTRDNTRDSSRGEGVPAASPVPTTLLRDMWRFGLPTLPSAFSAIMLQVSDRPIMRALMDANAVGIYQTNFRLGIPMMLAVSVFEQAWKPFYLREAGSKQARTLFPKVLTYFTVVCAMIFLSVTLFIEYAVRMPFVGGQLVNPKYLSGLGVIPFVMLGYYCNGVFTNLAAGAYIRKRTKYLPAATGLAAAVSVGMNFLLIPRMGMMGAAVAMCSAYFVSAVFMYRMMIVRRVYPLRYEWSRIAGILSITALAHTFALAMTERMAMLPSLFLRFCCLALAMAVFAALILRGNKGNATQDSTDDRASLGALWRRR
jgi:O-antigen/teichoic acid export membrane protein